MNRTVEREDPQLGFRWGESEGTYYLEHPDGDGYRRVSEDALTLLRKLASGEVARADLDRNRNAADLVDRLERNGYLDPDAPVVRVEEPPDIRLWPRTAVFVVLLAVGLYAGWVESTTLGGYAELFDPTNLATLAVLTGVSVAAHEAAHYVVARRFVDPSVRLGLVNAVLPAFITDTTGAWALPRNRRRWITLAGPYVELWLLAGFATLHYLAFPDSVVLGATVLALVGHILFSLNPLVHGDGYWLLTDTLGVVNLRTRGLDDLRSRTPSLAAGYVVVSYAYGIATLVVSVVLAYRFFGPF